jgi:hypothetical protein
MLEGELPRNLLASLPGRLARTLDVLENRLQQRILASRICGRDGALAFGVAALQGLGQGDLDFTVADLRGERENVLPCLLDFLFRLADILRRGRRLGRCKVRRRGQLQGFQDSHVILPV